MKKNYVENAEDIVSQHWSCFKETETLPDVKNLLCYKAAFITANTTYCELLKSGIKSLYWKQTVVYLKFKIEEKL